MINNLNIANISYKPADPNSSYYTVACECGWYGSSELLNGGNEIADTGDHEDTYCPVCDNNDLQNLD